MQSGLKVCGSQVHVKMCTHLKQAQDQKNSQMFYQAGYMRAMHLHCGQRYAVPFFKLWSKHLPRTTFASQHGILYLLPRGFFWAYESIQPVSAQEHSTNTSLDISWYLEREWTFFSFDLFVRDLSFNNIGQLPPRLFQGLSLGTL